MKKLFVSLILGLSLALGGCGGSFLVHSPEKIEQMTPVQKAQAGLDQTKATVTAIVRQVTADRKLGVYNDVEWVKIKAKLNQIKAHIDNAEEAIKLGNLVQFEDKKKLAEAAILFLKTELIKRSVQE